MIHPLFTSRIIWSIQLKAILISAEKCIARKIPVAVWVTKHNPNKDPKFQKWDKLLGAGKSIMELFAIFRMGCVLRKEVISDFIFECVLKWVCKENYHT